MTIGIDRRGLLFGLSASITAPAVIRTAGLLMPVRKIIEPEWIEIDLEAGVPGSPMATIARITRQCIIPGIYNQMMRERSTVLRLKAQTTYATA